MVTMCNDDESEEAVFRAHCGSKVEQWDAMRRLLRGRRGLVLRWHALFGKSAGSHGIGTGHLLEVAFRMHALCLMLRRYCYVELYDTEYQVYFGYADGQSWAPEPQELLLYRTHHHIQFNTSDHATELLRNHLYEALAAPAYNQHDGLLDVSIRGAVPLFREENTATMDTLSMSGAMDSHIPNPSDANLHRIRGLDPCHCRYVTQPRLTDRMLRTSFPRHAVHLRSGLADAPPREHLIRWSADSAHRSGTKPPPREETARRWARAACEGLGGNASASEAVMLWREPVFVVSDSPSLVRALRELAPASIVTLEYEQQGGSTRSWDADREAKFRALDALVATGRASTLYVTPQQLLCHCDSHGALGGVHEMHAHGIAHCPRYSLGGNKTRRGGLRRRCDNRHWSSFYRPLVTRSVCITQVALHVPGCAGFARTYLRDLPIRLAMMAAAAAAGPDTVVRATRKLHAESAEKALVGLRWALGASHPCSNISAAKCYRALLEHEFVLQW